MAESDESAGTSMRRALFRKFSIVSKSSQVNEKNVKNYKNIEPATQIPKISNVKKPKSQPKVHFNDLNSSTTNSSQQSNLLAENPSQSIESPQRKRSSMFSRLSAHKFDSLFHTSTTTRSDPERTSSFGLHHYFQANNADDAFEVRFRKDGYRTTYIHAGLCWVLWSSLFLVLILVFAASVQNGSCVCVDRLRCCGNDSRKGIVPFVQNLIFSGKSSTSQSAVGPTNSAPATMTGFLNQVANDSAQYLIDNELITSNNSANDFHADIDSLVAEMRKTEIYVNNLGDALQEIDLPSDKLLFDKHGTLISLMIESMYN